MNGHWALAIIVAIVILTLAEVSALIALAIVVQPDQLAILLGALSAIAVPTVGALLALLRSHLNSVDIKRNTEALEQIPRRKDDR